jgi:hypothetical protein
MHQSIADFPYPILNFNLPLPPLDFAPVNITEQVMHIKTNQRISGLFNVD